MDLEFDRTIDDIIAFNLFHMSHSPAARRSLLTGRLLTTLMAVALSGGLYLLTPRYFNWIVLAAAMLAGAVVFLLYPVFIRRGAISEIRNILREGNNDSILGHQKLQFSPEGILASNRSGEQRIHWSAVQRLAEGEKHLFLFTSAMHALVIPRSCFKTPEDQRAFGELVETYRRGQ